jgi:hypothetical protein
VPDSKLDQAVKFEYPVGMEEQEALKKLEERGLYASSRNIVERRPSEDEPSTEHFVVILSNQQISFVNKEYLLVLKINTHSHRIKDSSVSYGLTGF